MTSSAASRRENRVSRPMSPALGRSIGRPVRQVHRLGSGDAAAGPGRKLDEAEVDRPSSGSRHRIGARRWPCPARAAFERMDTTHHGPELLERALDLCLNQAKASRVATSERGGGTLVTPGDDRPPGRSRRTGTHHGRHAQTIPV